MLVLPLFVALLATCHCKINISVNARNFSMELMYHTAVEKNWNTVMSPLSVWSLLSGMSFGVVNRSRKQLRKGLFLPMSNKFVQDFKNLMQDVIISEGEDVKLKIGNYLFADTDVEINEKYETSFKNDFKGLISKVKFQSPQRATDEANDLVRKSIGIKQSVFLPDDFKDSKMILTNVITFEGRWRSPFKESDTREMPFYDEKGNEIGKVNMMYQSAGFPFTNMRSISAYVLELPYGSDERYSFLGILPHEGVLLTEVYGHFVRFSIMDILKRLNDVVNLMGESEVIVNLPRFHLSTNIVLNRPLQKMGIVDIFDSRMRSFDLLSSSDLYVSRVIHKTDIKVTENGTVASAVSTSDFGFRMKAKTFNANRPFMYFIVEKTTGTIIFSGVYSEPTIF